MSVVGSAIALHSVTTAGCCQDVLRQNPLSEELERKKVNLIRAMTTLPNVVNTTTTDNDSASRTEGEMRKEQNELYQQNIANASVQLATCLSTSSSLSETAQESLKSRCVAVMNGEDPVFCLLDNRMRLIFRDMMVFDNVSKSSNDNNVSEVTSDSASRNLVPTHLRTGIQSIGNNKNNEEESTTTKTSSYTKSSSSTYRYYYQTKSNQVFKPHQIIKSNRIQKH